jgi:hypothetical protein
MIASSKNNFDTFFSKANVRLFPSTTNSVVFNMPPVIDCTYDKSKVLQLPGTALALDGC